MRTPDEPWRDDLSKSAPPEGTPEHYEYLHITTRVARLKERIASDRQAIESLQSEDHSEDTERQLYYLRNVVRQHETELVYWQLRLERLQSFSGLKNPPK